MSNLSRNNFIKLNYFFEIIKKNCNIIFMFEMKFMEVAILEAKKAARKNFTPIGSVITCENKIISKAHNNEFEHAEMICIKKAQKKLKTTNLSNCKIFCTVSCCPMCLYCIKLAKIPVLIYGCENLKIIEHKLEIISHVKEDECREIISSFFNKIRNSKT